MTDKHQYNIKSAEDLKEEKRRLEAEIAEKEANLKKITENILDKVNPVPGITSLLDKDKSDDKPIRAVVDTGVNLMVGRVIASRVPFIPPFLRPFVAKTISDQLMKLDVKGSAMNALDWVIKKTDDKADDGEEKPSWKERRQAKKAAREARKSEKSDSE